MRRVLQLISKYTITRLSNNLADKQFVSWCSELDVEIYKCLDMGFEGERISIERKERIKNGFAAAMQKRGEENKEVIDEI